MSEIFYWHELFSTKLLCGKKLYFIE